MLYFFYIFLKKIKNIIQKFQNFSLICLIKIHKIFLQTQNQEKGCFGMSSNKNVVPEAKEALNRFKMEAASEVGVNLKQGYNGDLTSKQAGSVGGQMVKKMIKAYEESMK